MGNHQGVNEPRRLSPLHRRPPFRSDDRLRNLHRTRPWPHTVKILFPQNTSWAQTFNIVAGRTYCIALNYRPRTITVPEMTASHCPYSVTVTSPPVANEGDVVTFVADVGYRGPSALTYTWTISPPAARILSRADTQAIAVASTGLTEKRLTAVLVVDDG